MIVSSDLKFVFKFFIVVLHMLTCRAGDKFGSFGFLFLVWGQPRNTIFFLIKGILLKGRQ